MSEKVNAENVLKSVHEIISKRIQEKPEKSYVVSLVNKGLKKILSKIDEESQEVIEAANEGFDNKELKEHLIYEICDLFFHTLVLASHANISYVEIENELARRFGISGIIEKESRKKENK